MNRSKEEEFDKKVDNATEEALKKGDKLIEWFQNQEIEPFYAIEAMFAVCSWIFESPRYTIDAKEIYSYAFRLAIGLDQGESEEIIKKAAKKLKRGKSNG